MSKILKIHRFNDFIITVHEDGAVEGRLKDSTSSIAEILFYNDERGKRVGGSNVLPVDFDKAARLINLYKAALDIVSSLR